MPPYKQPSRRLQKRDHAREESQPTTHARLTNASELDPRALQLARLDPRRLSAAHVLQLQRVVGNQAMRSIIQRLPEKAAFIQDTETGHTRKRVVTIDNLLEKFHNLPPHDYEGRLVKMDEINAACKHYLEPGSKGHGARRRAGVKRLQAQIKQERPRLEEAAKWVTPTAPLRPDQIAFVSMFDGRVGSIYFPNDTRIRLIHKNGPNVDHHPGVERYSLSNEQYDKYAEWVKKKYRRKQERRKYVRDKMKVKVATAESGGDVLVEFFRLAEGWGVHVSRGGPAPFPGPFLEQEQLNIIYNAAVTNSTDMLRRAMQSDDALSNFLNTYL
jgi:hypothetical protein